jgi:hypothetical protein
MAFNPNEHLIQIKNRGGAADYLPVQWRLVWFREVCPNGTIETEIVHIDLDKETEEEVFVWNNEKRRSEKVVKTAPGVAIVRATVKDGKGGIATGTKMERASAFADYLEKAETGAIGRALAALGYGTQFSPELDEAHRIVDAPVDRGIPAESGGSENGHSNGNGYRTLSPLRPVTNNSNNGAGAAKSNGSGNSSRTAASVDAEPAALATEQQIASIRKLCEHLGKAEPEKLDALSYASAKELIAQMSQEYRQSRKAS